MRHGWRLSALSAGVVVGALACENGEISGNGPGGDGSMPGAAGSGGQVLDYTGAGVDAQGNACLTNRDFLAIKAWQPVIGTKCLSCHGPGGVADLPGTEYKLLPSAYPGFLDVNLQNLAEVAKTENEGVSIVLRKPLGELNHGGGAVLQVDTPEYNALVELVDRVTNGTSCEEASNAGHINDVIQLDALGTFRKAALQLNGRLPTAEEQQALVEGGEDALRTAVRGLFTEDAFYTRLIEIFNDQWLTDRYLPDANGILSDDDFPLTGEYFDLLSGEEATKARRSMAREPLELMAYIVKNDRSFQEIVTADYTVLNAYTALAYNNADMEFADPYNDRVFREGKIFAMKEGQLVPFPHAGILTSPMFLNRYPTSPTNLNRHRARIVLREFLATDILRIADRPIDPTKSVNFANPTREDPDCKTCHVVIDPIAGAFQKWDDNDYEDYRPDREWPAELFLPGFGTEQMQVNEYPEALQWLGQRIANDPRFPLSVVRNVLHSMTGKDPVDFPDDPARGGFIAWQGQDAMIRSVAEKFVESGYNFKTVMEEIVLSPYYRAVNTTATDPVRADELAEFGTGTLLTPELLNRKLLATIGFTWGSLNEPALLRDFNILYGGMDSNGVTARLTTPNGLMSAIQWRLANEVACRGVPYDFSKNPELRGLFPHVETTTVPEDEFGEAVETNVVAIRDNIKHMAANMWGAALSDTELDDIYKLFVDTWKEGRGRLVNESVPRGLHYSCQFRADINTGVEVPEELRIQDDPNYVIRSWMAVTSYMLADYRFLYE